MTLSKNECIQAFNEWKNAKYDYSKIKELINPQFAFSINREQIDWVNIYNRYKNFHIYIGIHDNELILIIVPLDVNGQEIKLPSYVFSSLLPLSQELNLVEKEEITKIKTTVLSQDLRIISYTESFKQPAENEPAIDQKTAAQEIETWTSGCLDWFYLECNEFNGKRIFETFTVPFADLGKPDEAISQVVSLFAFKYSPLYQRQIPTLIFVSVNILLLQAQLIEPPIDTNTYDWSQPCPPFCKDESTFQLLE
ncbi:MAG: hypothetical protein V4663_11695 [Bacteroidota bacterium]